MTKRQREVPTLQPALGRRLLELREAAGLTLFQAAYLSDTTPQSVSNWENGYRTPTLDPLSRLVKTYGTTLDALTTEKAS